MQTIGSKATESMQTALSVLESEITYIQDQEKRNIAKKNKLTDKFIQKIQREIQNITLSGKICTSRLTEPYLPITKH